MTTIAILLTGLGTYAMRACFIIVLARHQFSPTVVKVLEYVAPAVMASLVISMMTSDGAINAGTKEVIGLIAAALAAKISGNHALALIAGMGTFWLIGWLI